MTDETEDRPTSGAARNITWSDGAVSRADRERLTGASGCVVWFTGLSGSGKSTLARELEAQLTVRGRLCYVLDGDNIRHGLNADLDFSPEGRAENIRRVGEVAALFADAGLVTIVSFISPYREGRQHARDSAGDGRFIEVHLATPIDVCESRDPKGLYAKARAGDIHDFTGIDAPYEAPESPEIVIDTSTVSVQDGAAEVVRRLVIGGHVTQ
jgi:adenylylsulfate kinase